MPIYKIVSLLKTSKTQNKHRLVRELRACKSALYVKSATPPWKGFSTITKFNGYVLGVDPTHQLAGIFKEQPLNFRRNGYSRDNLRYGVIHEFLNAYPKRSVIFKYEGDKAIITWKSTITPSDNDFLYHEFRIGLKDIGFRNGEPLVTFTRRKTKFTKHMPDFLGTATLKITEVTSKLRYYLSLIQLKYRDLTE